MDTTLPTSGAETRISLSVDGAPILISGQVDKVSAKQRVSNMEHKPLGTSDVKIGQDFNGWEGSISGKRSSLAIATAINLIEASNRAGLPSQVMLTVTSSLHDGTRESHLYSDVKLSYSGDSARGSFDSFEVSWVTGSGRVAL